MKYRFLLSLLVGLCVFNFHASAQLVGDNAFLQGRWLEVGIAPNGSWGNTMPVPAGYNTRPGSSLSYPDPITGTTPTGNGLDFSYDQGHDGWTVGSPAWYGAYYLPGTPFDGWSIQLEDTMSSAFYSSGRFDTTLGGTFGGTVTTYNYNPATCGNPQASFDGIWQGYAGLKRAGYRYALAITQTNHLDTNASWLNVTTKFVNTTNDTLHGIYYMATADPDNDEDLPGGSFPTNNHIAYQGGPLNRHEVWARPPSIHQDAFSGLATMDCRAQVLIYQSWPPSMVRGNDLDLVWAGTATSMGGCYYTLGATTYTQDIAYAVIFNVGNLAPHDSTFVSYAWIFSDTTAIDSSVATVPSLITEGLNHSSTITDSVFECTMSGCGVLGHTFTADILNGDNMYWTNSTWTWSPARGLSASTGAHVIVNFDSVPGPMTYTITGTQDISHGRCGTSGPIRFLLFVQPCFYATSNSPGPTFGQEICITDTLKLNAPGDSTGASYFWYGPTGYTSFTQRATRTGMSTADTGWYTVVRTVGASHDTARTHVLLKKLPVVTATSNSPICSGPGNTLLFNASPDSSIYGETFTWSGPNGFSSGLVNPTYFGPPTSASGNYKVVTSWRGCKDSAIIFDVMVDSTPALPLLSTNTPICSGFGDTMRLFGNDVTPNVRFHWTGPAGFSYTGQYPVIPNPTVGDSGIYTVVVDTFYGSLRCSNTANVLAVVDSTPYLPTDSSNSPICSGTALYLFANSTLGSTYTWTGPNAFTSGFQNPTINPASTSASGVYFITASKSYTTGGPLTCTSAAATLLAVVDTTPAPPVAYSNSPGPPGISICEGDTLRLFSSDVTSGVSFNWAGPNSFTSALQNPIIAPVSPAATGNYTVTATFGTMCVASSVISVSITPTPPLTATSNSPVCTGVNDTLFLQASSNPGVTYYWTGPYVFRSSLQNPARTPVISEYGGIYHVTATTPNNCFRTVDDTVVIRQTPEPPRVSWQTFCQYFDAPFLQAMGDSILWYNTYTSTVGVLNAPKPQTNLIGSKFYYVTQTLLGCTSAKDSFRVTVNPSPAIQFSPDTAVCPHDTATLRAIDTSGSVLYYHWFPPLYLVGDTSQATVKTLPVNNIHYTVVASNQYGCSDTGGMTISVYAAAVINVGDSVTIYPGESYQISPQTNCSYFSWFPYQGLSSPNISNPLATPDVDTKYMVHAVTSWGCAVDDSLNIYVSYESLLDAPNAFTPGNGVNNKFKILKRGIATLNNFSIYDRWGVKVFETTNIDEGWDGTYKGKPQPEGVYVYQINAVTSSGKPFVKHGNITLIR
jgi:gliding motility-associated-like protein